MISASNNDEGSSRRSSSTRNQFDQQLDQASTNNEFLNQTGENADLNQYWYSKQTIDVLCNAIREGSSSCDGIRVAFLSTPSLFFSLSEEEREHCELFDVSSSFIWNWCFVWSTLTSGLHISYYLTTIVIFVCSQFDSSWKSCQGYHFYDYNDPTNIKDSCRNAFDVIVIDPPFISQSVWVQYAITAKLLMKDSERASCIIGTTVDENKDLMKSLFGCEPAPFRPSIPHLVYQYSVFVNFPSKVLAERNPELEETWNLPSRLQRQFPKRLEVFHFDLRYLECSVTTLLFWSCHCGRVIKYRSKAPAHTPCL